MADLKPCPFCWNAMNDLIRRSEAQALLACYTEKNNLGHTPYQIVSNLPSAGPKWISVKERLPKYGDYVLGIGPRRGYYICEYRGLIGIPKKASPRFMAQGRSVKITHWMPLPEPPKEGGGEDG